MRRLVAFLFAAFLILAVTSPACAGWSDVKKRFVDAVEKRAPIDETLEHARAVIADGKPRAQKLMIKVLDDLVDREWATRDEAIEVSGKIYKGEDYWSRKVSDRLEKLLRLAEIDHELGMRIADEMSKAPESFREALVTAARKRKDGRLHAVAVRMMANLPKDGLAIGYVLELLGGEAYIDRPDVRVAALRSLAVEAEAWDSVIADRVNDPDWAVQVEAARMAAQYGLNPAIGDMIGQMSCAMPRVQEAFVGCLQSMTGQTIGRDPDRWRFWWRTNQARFPGAKPAGGGSCDPFGYVRFYDLEIHSNRILFVVDISGSMNRMAVEFVDDGGREVESKTHTRMDMLKAQLDRAIRGLPDGDEFNIVAFGGEVQAWQKEMTRSNERTRKDAVRWIQKLKPDGSTQLNGAMHAIWGDMGFGDATVAPLVADTMVILSDGAPTDGWPSGRGEEGRAVVLSKVNQWNRHKAVVIHTVALKGAAVDFLKQLAEENGGQCSVR